MWVKICQNAWLLHLKVNKKDQGGRGSENAQSAYLCTGTGTFSHWCAAATSQGGTMASHEGQQDLRQSISNFDSREANKMSL